MGAIIAPDKNNQVSGIIHKRSSAMQVSAFEHFSVSESFEMPK